MPSSASEAVSLVLTVSVVAVVCLTGVVSAAASDADGDSDDDQSPVFARILTSPLFDVGRLWLRATAQQAHRVVDFLLELVINVNLRKFLTLNVFHPLFNL